jgi:hypothetical protein
VSDSYDGGGSALPPPSPGGPTGGPFTPPSQPVYSNPVETPNYNAPVADLASAPSPAAPKRSRGKMIGALVGVVALLGAGAFAVTQIAGSDGGNGGASSAKAVGDDLVKALDGEDLLGVVDLLLPGERDTFRQPLVDLNTELARLEVTDKAVDLSSVPAIDIEIKDPVVRSRSTNVDDIANVEVKGTATVKLNGKELPIGGLLTDSLFGGKNPDVESQSKTSDFDFTFTTVKQGSQWYLSLFYSIATNALGDDVEIPETGVTPVGADTPEGAVDNLIVAATKLDLNRIVAGLNPNEAAALQRFAPLFLGDAQDEMDDANVSINVTGAQYKVTGSGDERQVALTAIHVKAVSGDQSIDIELKDGCLKFAADEFDYDSCSTTSTTDEQMDDTLGQLGVGDVPELQKLFDDAKKAFSDFEEHGIVVNKVDGKWYVSPIGTYTEVVLSFLRALDRDEIDTLINDGKAAFQAIFEQFDESFDLPDFPDDTGASPTTVDDSTDATDDTVTDVTVADSTDTESTDTESTDTESTDTESTEGAFPDDSDASAASIDLDTTGYWSDCLFTTNVTDPKGCIAKGLEDGRFSPDDVPAPYQFPDCGLFDYYYGTDLYSDSPEQFQETIEPHLQCIVDAAAKAGANLEYSSPEFAHPECFVGVNPYNYSGDNSDEINKAFDCASGFGS